MGEKGKSCAGQLDCRVGASRRRLSDSEHAVGHQRERGTLSSRTQKAAEASAEDNSSGLQRSS